MFLRILPCRNQAVGSAFVSNGNLLLDTIVAANPRPSPIFSSIVSTSLFNSLSLSLSLSLFSNFPVLCSETFLCHLFSLFSLVLEI